jgi:hypothetical protein
MKMKSSKIFIGVLLLAVVVMLSSPPVFASSGNGSNNPCSGFNAQINPGNQTGIYENSSVTAQGGANKGDNIICSWSQATSDTIQVAFDHHQCELSFTAPEVDPSGSELNFTLSVTGTVNGNTCSDSKPTKIDVENISNQAPTASVTATPNIANEGEIVTLDGTKSSDPDSDNLTYTWTQVIEQNNPTTQVTINNSTSSVATFTAPAEQYPNGETLTFMLTVSDGTLSGSTTVTVTVQSVNLPPTTAISQQCPISVNEGVTVTLDGIGSSDPDQGDLEYQWSQVQGIPNADLTGVDLTQPSISFTAPQLISSLNTMKFGLTVTDNGGLKNNAECDIVVLDVTPPSIECTGPYQTIWYGDNVTVNCSASDVASGLADDTLASFALTTNVSAGAETDSAQTNSKEVCDIATNCDTAGPYTFKVDKKAPTLSCGAADTAWHATDQSVTCTATDGGSGPASQTVTLSTNVPVGTETSSASTGSQLACDLVGNCATAGPVTGFMIDKKAPQPTGCDSPDGQWHSGDVTLKCHYADDGSGPSTQDVSLTTSVASGSETYNAAASANGAQACDTTNNCAATPSDIAGNKIDKKAPSDITLANSAIDDGSSYYFGFVPPAPTCNATDNGSGLNSCVVTGYDTKVGTHTLTATATDNVGNMSTATLTYTVMAWTLTGFYQPVDMSGVWNTVKNGATVPLKFQVLAGPTELTDIAVIDMFIATSVACPKTGYVADDVEFTTTGNTTLRYDTISHQFIQNWQTPKKPGACYRVTMTTDDGSNLTANFILK